jgi:hypothetical protein
MAAAEARKWRCCGEDIPVVCRIWCVLMSVFSHGLTASGPSIWSTFRLLDCFPAGHRKATTFTFAWFVKLRILGEHFVKHLVIN